MDKLRGHSVIYSDAPEWESMWLRRLGVSTMRVADILELISIDKRDVFSMQRSDIFLINKLMQHRADHDALAKALTLNKLIS